MNYKIRINEVNKEDSRAKAYATVVFSDSLVVRNIAIVERKDGNGVFVSMPSQKTKEVDENNNSVYKDICNPITAEFQQEFTGFILKAYEMKKEGSLEKEGLSVGSGEERLPFKVRVTPYEREGSNIRGFASVYLNDSFVVGSISIINGRNGEFVEAFCALGYTETSLSARDHILVLAQPNNFVGHLNIQVAAEWPPDILPPKELHGSLRPDITVFLVPHQDDELYTYGLAIRSRIAAGQNLCTILVADGGACEARGILNDGGSCECLGDSHAYELSVDEFVEARDREYVESCQLLGLPEGNIHFAEHRLPDVQVTEQGSAAIILKVLLSYPFATICAHAPRFEVSMDPSERCLSSAPHHDHCMIGRAVERLIAEGVLYSAEFFIEFYDIERFKRENKDIFLLEREVSNEEVRGVQAALAAYKKWDPESGRFAVGWHSGAEYFEWAEENNVITSYDPMLSHFEDIPSQALANHIVELQADNRSCQERLLQLLKQLDVVERRLSELESSTTWKVGRIVMALPCKAKELLQSIRGL